MDDEQDRTATSDGYLSVDVLLRLARGHLTTSQLVDLIGHLELELIARSTISADWLVDERPQTGRGATRR